MLEEIELFVPVLEMTLVEQSRSARLQTPSGTGTTQTTLRSTTCCSLTTIDCCAAKAL